MATRPMPGEIATLTQEMGEHYLLGQIAAAANITGADDLSNMAIASLTYALQTAGITEPNAIASAIETGGLVDAFVATGRVLFTRGVQGAKYLAKKPSALLTLGLSAGAYSWLSSRDEASIEETRAQSAVIRGALEKATTPAERLKLIQAYLDANGGGTSTGTVVAVVGFAALLGLGLWALLRK